MQNRKKKVLHVDELIVKANKVIILDENKKKKDNVVDPIHRDPWGWPLKKDTLESSSSESKDFGNVDEDRRDPWL